MTSTGMEAVDRRRESAGRQAAARLQDAAQREAAARRLDVAARDTTAIDPLSSAGQISITEAYQIQASGFGLRKARGETGSGVKLGFTSRAKMLQMGISEVIVGRLTHQMAVPDGGEVELDRLIHPRIEPEIAYLLGRDIDVAEETGVGPDVVAAVAPAVEIIDSRYRNFSFGIADVIADNASAARYALGPWQRPEAAGELGNLAVRLRLGGRVVEVGSTAAILGHPARVLPRLLALSRSVGIPLRAGDVILAGAATPAAPLPPGPAEAEVARLGRVALRAVPGEEEPDA